jgi:hypothetical protein
MKDQTRTRESYLALGLCLGLLLGLVVGLSIQGIWPNVPLHASATQGQENFAFATGLVDDQIEAIYFLDFITGDLKAAVISPKSGKFNSFFTYNIRSDFEDSVSKNPKYLMVTGLADFPRGRGQTQVASSILYITEANSGMVAAYSIPWNQAAQVAGRSQGGKFVPLDRGKFRTMMIREDE